VRDGDWVTATSRRAAITLQAMVVRTIRPDTVFVPYHWPESRSANLLTHRSLDPAQQDPRVQGLGLPPGEGGRSAAWAARRGKPVALPVRSF
jgi:predicted molibdopterin-dependent oxidoreductase YjgC